MSDEWLFDDKISAELTERSPQYSMVIKTSSGVLQKSRAFFTRKTRGEPERSAITPHRHVKKARVKPIMVRN